MTGVAADTLTLRSRWAAALNHSALFAPKGLLAASPNDRSWQDNPAEHAQQRLHREALLAAISFPRSGGESKTSMEGLEPPTFRTGI